MESNVSSFRDEGLLYFSLNQDFTCLVAGTERGFKIYNTNPFGLKYERSKEHFSFNFLLFSS